MTYRKKLVASMLAVLGLAILTGCGSGQPPRSVPGGTGSNPGGGMVGGGCIPMNSMTGGMNQIGLGFQGQNVYFNWTNIVGGRLPMSGQPVGVVNVGAGGAAGTSLGGGQLQRTNWRGSRIMMQIMPSQQANQVPYQGYPNGSFPYQNQQYNPYGGYPYGGMHQAQISNVTGALHLSMEELYFMTGGMGGFGGMYGGYPTGGYPYGGMMPNQPGQFQQQLCFNGMGFDLGVYNGTLYAGNVYLYSNSGTPMVVEF